MVLGGPCGCQKGERALQKGSLQARAVLHEELGLRLEDFRTQLLRVSGSSVKRHVDVGIMGVRDSATTSLPSVFLVPTA